MLFIGTQFSILYTSMYSPAEAATHLGSLDDDHDGVCHRVLDHDGVCHRVLSVTYRASLDI